MIFTQTQTQTQAQALTSYPFHWLVYVPLFSALRNCDADLEIPAKNHKTGLNTQVHYIKYLNLSHTLFKSSDITVSNTPNGIAADIGILIHEGTLLLRSRILQDLAPTYLTDCSQPHETLIQGFQKSG